MYNKFKHIKTIVSDIDGVLTNSNLLIANDGKLWRVMNSRDGLASVLALNAGFQIMIISGGRNEAVGDRLKGLGITEIHLGCYDKHNKIQDLLKKYGLNKSEVAYIGDDLNDLAALDYVGLKICPKDAAPEIKEKVDYISSKKGGEGVLRDVVEKVMRLNDCWHYFKSS